MLTEHACGPEGELQAPIEDLGTAAHVCLPSAIEAELRGSQCLTGLTESVSSRFGERPCLKPHRREHLRKTHNADFWHPHVCDYVQAYHAYSAV